MKKLLFVFFGFFVIANLYAVPNFVSSESETGAGASTFSFYFTPSGNSNEILILSSSVYSYEISSATWDGESFIKITSIPFIAGSYFGDEMWYLPIGSQGGTQETVTINYISPTSECDVVLAEYSNVSQTNPILNYNSNACLNCSPLDITLTTTSTNSIVVTGLSFYANVWPAGLISPYIQENTAAFSQNPNSLGDSNGNIVPGSNTITWTLGSQYSDYASGIAIELAGVPPTPTCTPTYTNTPTWSPSTTATYTATFTNSPTYTLTLTSTPSYSPTCTNTPICIASPQPPPCYITQWGTSGNGNGQFDSPVGVAVDSNGNVYVSDEGNNRIQEFSSTGAYITQWGGSGSGNGQFDVPYGVAVDSSGVYVVDSYNNRIQKFSSTGTYITQWGGSGNGNGQFDVPYGIAVDSSGVYVVDNSNSRIQKFSSTGTYITQWGSNGSGNGQFNDVIGVATDSSGYVYVADSGHDLIQKFSSSGTYITQWGGYGTGDGQFIAPVGIVIDSSGNVYVTDLHNNRIQEFNSLGCYITQWGGSGNGDGQFNYPEFLTMC